MSNVLELVSDAGNSEFYPTPERVIDKMLADIDWWKIQTILEPSAGKGDILRSIAHKEHQCRHDFDVDAIEIDPQLRQVLKYNFSDELKNKSDKAEKLGFFENGLHIVHDDFLSYQPYKEYDLIVMNPPFSNGDKHLLKALQMQEHGGMVVCLLNAETIRNPYTQTRKALLDKLNEYQATIQYIEGGFTNAERKTGVEVALVKVTVPRVQEDSNIYRRFEAAAEVEDVDPTVTDIAVTDFIRSIVSMYNVEVKSGMELIRQYRAMVPYMRCVMGNDSSGPILRLTDSTDRGYDSVSTNNYLRRVRLKYWEALLKNPKFVSKLTSKLQEKYYKRVETLADYDFSEFNIQQLTTEMNAEVKGGIESEIEAMFDRLTQEHSWYPECAKNRHYFDGWKTNIAHKIGKKVIIPCYGVYDAWDGRPRVYEAKKTLADIERVLNFLDGHMTADVDMETAIDSAFKAGITKKIPLKFFEATFYKKGTVHLTFNCPELIDRYNIYIARGKNWLPPCYGYKQYKDMDAEERATVDSFQGEKEYTKVMERSGYYLAPATNGNLLAIGG